MLETATPPGWVAKTSSSLGGGALWADYRCMEHGPRRIRSHGDQLRGRLAGAPFIPAVPDPDVELAAQAAAAAAATRIMVVAGAPATSRRVLALLVDLLMVALLAAVAADMNAALPLAAVLIFAWVIIRLLPLVLLGQTPGQTLAGYEVRGPRGARLGPARAAAREGILFTAVVWIPWGIAQALPLAGGDTGGSRNELDRRWPHDLFSDSWVIRRDALAPAPGTLPHP